MVAHSGFFGPPSQSTHARENRPVGGCRYYGAEVHRVAFVLPSLGRRNVLRVRKGGGGGGGEGEDGTLSSHVMLSHVTLPWIHVRAGTLRTGLRL